MFFVLNVGRSGSRTLAQVLSQAPNITCLHEPEPQLVEEASRYRTGALEEDQLVELLRATRTEPANGVYGETANKLALVVPALRRAFPDARLVWLVRDGRAMVTSAVQRGWYAPDEDDDTASEWARHRPTPMMLDGTGPEEWESWDQFERVCWYWARVNRLIQEDASAAELLLLRLEDLTARIDDTAAWVGAEPTAFTVTHANRRYTAEDRAPADAKRSNLVDRRLEPRDWTDGQRATFERHCGPLMDELYPGWRDPDESTDASSAEPTGESTARVLVSLREEVAELRLGLHDVHDLRRERDELTQRVATAEGEADQLRTRTERLTAQLEEVEATAAAHRDRQEALDGQLAVASVRHQELEHRVDELSALLTGRDETIRTLRERAATLERRLASESEWRRRVTGSVAYRVVAWLARVRRRVRGLLVRALRTVFTTLPTGLRDRLRDVRARRRHARLTVDESVPRIIEVPGRAGGRDLPVVGVLMWDAGPADVEDAITQVRTLQDEIGDFAPLFVTDATVFQRFRESSLVFEYVPPREQWETHFPHRPYEEFVSRRLSGLLDAYRPDQVVTLDLGSRHRASSSATLRACVMELHDRRRRRQESLASLASSRA